MQSKKTSLFNLNRRFYSLCFNRLRRHKTSDTFRHSRPGNGICTAKTKGSNAEKRRSETQLWKRPGYTEFQFRI